MTALSHMTVGANAERSRSHNRQVVLARVRAAGQIGRAEVARASGLSTQAVSNIIADLLEDGLIVEQGRLASGRGLPPVQYGINPDGAYSVGVEIRPDAVFGGILNLNGDNLASNRHPLTANDRSSVTETVAKTVLDLCAATGISKDKLLGAGIVMPGPFGETGIRGSGSDLPVWDDISPTEWFAEKLDLQVTVENDANAAAMAERISGVAQGIDTYAFVYFGNGLGLGVVHKGQLISGAFGNAGELGHIPIQTTEGTRPLEELVSRMSIHSHLLSRQIEAPGGDDLSRLYQNNSGHILAWLDRAAPALSQAIAIIENLFDPQTIILGGAMPDALIDHLIKHCHMTARSVSNRSDRQFPRIQRGGTGRLTATLGAAALIINRAVTPQIAVQA